jgi:hypothetical protein
MRAVLVAVLLLGFGLLRLPWELRLENMQREAFFRGAELDLELRESVGQLGFLAALGGFRSLLAAILWIEAHTAWERTEWGRMAGLFNTVTALQPRSLLYWDMAAWHMAWNASVAAMNNPDQPSEILRQRAQRQYFELGRNFLERGLRNNPDRWKLYQSMGVLLRDKFEDHCAAGDYFAKASEFPGAPPFLARFAGYSWAQCPGRERQAYEHLSHLWRMGESQRLPSLINYLRELEEKLGIPEEERVEPLKEEAEDSAPAAPSNDSQA